MKRISQFACGIAVIVMAAIAVSSVYAQSVTARALFTYPMHGQTPEQESAEPPVIPGQLPRPDLIPLLCMQRSKLAFPPERSPMLHVEWLSLLAG